MERRDRPKKTALIIAKQIIADAERQGLGPGDRLQHEKAMIETYQVGRGTLRESLRFLELSGALSLKPGPNGGAILDRPDASHLVDSMGLLLHMNKVPLRSVVEARIGLEPLIALYAAERRTEDDVAALQENVAQMGRNLDDPAIFRQTNEDFHDLVGWASGNAVLGFLVEALDGIYETFSLDIEFPVERRKVNYEAHVSIAEAIANGDGEAASERMRDHVLEMFAYLEEFYPESVARPIHWHRMR